VACFEKVARKADWKPETLKPWLHESEKGS